MNPGAELQPAVEYAGNLVLNSAAMQAREDGATEEQAVEPDLAIVDAHHHLWHVPAKGNRYLFEDFAADVNSGHNIVASVFVEAGAMYRSTGPISFRPLGEIEFARGAAAMSASGNYGTCRIADAIVCHADLMAGKEVGAYLDLAVEAAGGRLRGIRQHTHYEDGHVGSFVQGGEPHRLVSAQFRAGAAQLVARDLSLDVWVYHPQLKDVIALAWALPNLTIVVNHVGGLIGVGRYALDRARIRSDWETDMRALAGLPNVYLKIGGMGMPIFGHGLHLEPQLPSSKRLAECWRATALECIEMFGAQRCMFESNFPVDKQASSYCRTWNAFKRLTSAHSASERAHLFKQTAATVYRIEA